MKAGNPTRKAILTAAGAIAAMALVAAPGEAGKAPPPQLFQTSDRCQACHNALVLDGGQSVSIGNDWRAAMMANSGRDPYWQAAVRREVMDHPTARSTIEDECSRCHLPMAHTEQKAAGAQPQLFAHLAGAAQQQPGRLATLAADGVSCSACHQITARGLGTRASFTGHYDVDTTRPWGSRVIYGPFDVDAGRTRVMQSASTMRPAKSLHVQQSELCASCHTLYTHALDPQGNVVGELPEQVPYLEWQHSAYRDRQACQSCHMPVVEPLTSVTSVLPQLRPQLSRHVFRGGNFFMMGLLARFGADLGVVATPEELTFAARRTAAHLRSSTAQLTVTCAPVTEGRLEAKVTVANLAGHKLPTAYPSRRAWLHVTVTDARGQRLFESGGLSPSGAIVGNDNDADPRRFEPHYDRITSSEQVQIYEPILGAPDGTVTTGLLTASHYLKDNRLLPLGFDKRGAASDVAVRGRAAADPSFRGGFDAIHYAVDVADRPGPFEVVAELWYQPIGHRWAHNLATRPALETNRFVFYYRSAAMASATLITRGSASTQP